MVESTPRRWLHVAILVGAIYVVVGLVTAAFANPAPTHPVRVGWRLTAWVASAIAFTAHVAHEVRGCRSAVASALHVALGVALGACGLAIAAIAHAFTTGTGNLRLLAIALVAWPALAGVPGFLVALAAATLRGRLRPRA